MVLGTATAAAGQESASRRETPYVIVDQATRAVSADTGEALAARWHARLARDSADRFARFGLAAIAVLTSDTASAASGLRVILAADDARDPEAHLLAAYARWGLASLANRVGRWDVAARGFADASVALRAGNDSAGEAMSLVSLVWFDTRAHRAAEASANLARADSLIGSHRNDLRAAWDCAHSAILSASHGTGAVEAADSGATLARQNGDLRLAAQCEFEAAGDLSARGYVEQAIPRLGDVIALSASTRDHATHAVALQWRGFGELNLGYYGPAEKDLLTATAEAAADGSLAGVGWSELNLAAVADEVGDPTAASKHAVLSYAALSAIRDSSGMGILQRDAARRALALGDTASARSGAETALAVAERQGRLEDVVGARIEVAAVDFRERRWDDAAKEMQMQRLLETGRAQGWGLDVPWYEGRISLGRGDPHAALRYFQRASGMLDSAQHLFRYELRVDMAVASLRTGDTTGAIAALQRADDEMDTWRATLDDAGLRVLAFSVTEPIPGPPSPNAEVIAAAIQSKHTATGFALAERQRARELTDQLLRVQALGVDHPRPIDVAGTGARAGTSPTITLAALQRALPDDSTALVEYVAGAASVQTAACVVTRRHVLARLAPLADSLSETIDRLNALVDHGVPATVPERALGAALLADLGRLPRAIDRLVIVPDGPLHRVPFAALRLSDGAPIIERYAISLAPSATVAVAEWARRPMERAANVLAFGDPVLPGTPGPTADSRDLDRGGAPPARSESTTANDSAPGRPVLDTMTAGDRDATSALAGPGGLPRLPWTAEEAALVAAFGQQSTVRLRADASALFLESTPLEEFSIVHFATHAIVDDVVPARSALALAPGGGRSGYVGPGDLAGLHLTADLVVLSACRTARGAVVTGEGVRGFTSPLLAAGARSVLATQWRLNDRDAVPMIYTLYREMAGGLPVAEAVRRAELAARDAGRPEREWASFILVGDPLVRIPLHVPPADRVPAWVRQYAEPPSPAPRAIARSESPGSPQTPTATSHR
jgi:CHAT domain-containing protein